MTQRQTEIKEMLLSLGVSDVGFCHTEEGDGIGGLSNAVSIVVHLSPAILAEVQDKPTHTYFNHYRSINAFIDHCLLRVGLLLDKHGYKYITVASSQSINDEGWFYRGRYSHKKIACLAGLGNMGNNCLFLHREYGAKVRLGTVFTDCQFENPTEFPPHPCTHCNICREKCGIVVLTYGYAGNKLHFVVISFLIGDGYISCFKIFVHLKFLRSEYLCRYFNP